MKNILRVDKPKGISSFAVVQIIRKERNIKKVGHAGTLDPLASGLMLIGVGKGTKKLESLLKLPKTYEVEVLLGESRSTGDMEGEVTLRMGVYDMDKKQLKKVLREMEGDIELPVPKFSAIKVDGERLYKKARRGEDFTPPLKVMVIKKLTLRSIKLGSGRAILKIKMEVGSGAYIRSIVEELGRRLGVPATTKNLRRTKIGKFGLLFSKRIK